MYSLKNKVALITGGANGIGASTVREFVNQGAKFVAFIDIEENAGVVLENELTVEHGAGIVRFFKCDVTKVEQLHEVYSIVLKDHGYIDVVVNNAGIADDSIEKYLTAIDVNFKALVTSSFKALELMRQDNGGKGGTIINVSSIVALCHNVGVLPVYAATKSAVLQFSNRLGLDEVYSRSNVRVLTACFGVTNTNILITCKGMDEHTDKIIKNFSDTCVGQTAEAAAQGLVEVYQTGKSGSTWLIDKSRSLEITDKIKKANEIMVSDVVIEYS